MGTISVLYVRPYIPFRFCYAQFLVCTYLYAICYRISPIYSPKYYVAQTVSVYKGRDVELWNEIN